jgi:8-oxo-dGTP diphosphatase
MTKKIHAAGIIFEDENGQILVLQRHPDKPEGATWGLPGGKLEPGESKEAAAIREIQEEIGHTVDRSKLEFVKTYHWDVTSEGMEVTFEVFRLKVRASETIVALSETEHTDHMWSLPADLNRRSDLMVRLYPILEGTYNLGKA